MDPITMIFATTKEIDDKVTEFRNDYPEDDWYIGYEVMPLLKYEESEETPATKEPGYYPTKAHKSITYHYIFLVTFSFEQVV